MGLKTGFVTYKLFDTEKLHNLKEIIFLFCKIQTIIPTFAELMWYISKYDNLSTIVSGHILSNKWL